MPDSFSMLCQIPLCMIPLCLIPVYCYARFQIQISTLCLIPLCHFLLYHFPLFCYDWFRYDRFRYAHFSFLKLYLIPLCHITLCPSPLWQVPRGRGLVFIPIFYKFLIHTNQVRSIELYWSQRKLAGRSTSQATQYLPRSKSNHVCTLWTHQI